MNLQWLQTLGAYLRKQICQSNKTCACSKARTQIPCQDDGSGKICGVVKWFNAEKGYGFIQPEGGGKDVFIHIAAVNRAGYRTLVEGQRVRFSVVTDRKTGKRAAELLELVGPVPSVPVAPPASSTPPTVQPGGKDSAGDKSNSACASGKQSGTVKWFNGTKGYGFIQPDNGGRDVFLHISAVERAGYRTIREGQRVCFEVVTLRRRGVSSAENLTLI